MIKEFIDFLGAIVGKKRKCGNGNIDYILSPKDKDILWESINIENVKRKKKSETQHHKKKS